MRSAEHERRAIGRPDRDEITVIVVFAGVMVGWLTQGMHGIHPGIVALADAVILFALGRLIPSDLGRISRSSLSTFGGGSDVWLLPRCIGNLRLDSYAIGHGLSSRCPPGHHRNSDSESSCDPALGVPRNHMTATWTQRFATNRLGTWFTERGGGYELAQEHPL